MPLHTTVCLCVHQLKLLPVVVVVVLLMLPCQTPTLGFCVERHQAIVAFQPEPFWVVRPSLSKVCVCWALCMCVSACLNCQRGSGGMEHVCGKGTCCIHSVV